MNLARRQVRIVNAKGLHARASRLFVTTAAQFDAAVTLRRDDLVVNADSVLSVLELVAAQGSVIEIVAEGREADAAANALTALVEAGFHERDAPGEEA